MFSLGWVNFEHNTHTHKPKRESDREWERDLPGMSIVCLGSFKGYLWHMSTYSPRVVLRLPRQWQKKKNVFVFLTGIWPLPTPTLTIILNTEVATVSSLPQTTDKMCKLCPWSYLEAVFFFFFKPLKDRWTQSQWTLCAVHYVHWAVG